MGLEIFKNADNNILFTGGGNVLKRPYDFGKSITVGTSGITPEIQVANLSLTPGFTVLSIIDLGFSKEDSLNNGVLWQHFNYKNTNDDIYKFGYNTLGSGYTRFNINGTNVFSQYGGFPPYTNWFMHIFQFNEDGLLTYREINTKPTGDKNVSNSYNNYSSSFPISQFSIGGSSMHPNTKYNQLSIFNRDLSNEELAYKFNNKSGNDYISVEGLVLNIKCSNAEILDFSLAQDGSDLRVGVRDDSGYNHHGQIMNLPAGTLQEQLDYANEKLFAPFIS